MEGEPSLEPEARCAETPGACRPATPADLPAIAVVHRAAFPGFFTSELGARFLCGYYRTVLEYPGGILLVHKVKGEVAGFAAGFRAPGEFYRRLRGRKVRLAVALLPVLITRPRMVGRIAHSFRRGAGDEPVGPDESAELSSIAVLPALGGQGIGRALAREFARQCGERGVEYVYLTTDADRNEQVVRFYERVGFSIHRTFEAYAGRRMHELRLRCT